MTDTDAQRILTELERLTIASNLHTQEAGQMRAAFASMVQGLQLTVEAIDRLAMGVAETNRAVSEFALAQIKGILEDMQVTLARMPNNFADAVQRTMKRTPL